jgi:DNA replication protein DnaC
MPQSSVKTPLRVKTKRAALAPQPDASHCELPASLQAHLQALELTYMAEHAATTAQHAAREGLAHLGYLEMLAAGEAARAHDRCVARRVASARFPTIKTMAGWNWSAPKNINRMQVEHLLKLGFLQNHANIVLLGPTGVGKTHLACALGHAACLERHSVLFASAIDIVNRLSAAQSAGQLAAELKRFKSPRMLVIDELGYLPLDRRGGELLFQVITKRYECGSTVITTNITFKEWPRYFAGDATMTSALLDRLLHHVEVVKLDGESYRNSKPA